MTKINLNVLLASKNMSQLEFSNITGIDKGTINRYCNNNCEKITIKHIGIICSYFKCTPNDLFILDSSLKTAISSTSLVWQKQPYIITGDEVLEDAKKFKEEHGYNPILTDDEYYELGIETDKLNLMINFTNLLSSLIFLITDNSGLSEDILSGLTLTSKSSIEYLKTLNRLLNLSNNINIFIKEIDGKDDLSKLSINELEALASKLEDVYSNELYDLIFNYLKRSKSPDQIAERLNKYYISDSIKEKVKQNLLKLGNTTFSKDKVYKIFINNVFDNITITKNQD